MDTSISKALIMVASVLLAMIVIAFMTFTFNRTGTWATTQDQEKLTEQIQKFNKEYEAYDKDLMYGVDVISCLNKVLANNDKITNEKVINGEKYDVSYAVNAEVEITSDMQESIIVMYRQRGASRENTQEVGENFEFGELFDKFQQYTEISENIESRFVNELKSQIKSSGLEKNKSYPITYGYKEGTGENLEKTLRQYLKLSNDLSKTIKNTGDIKEDAEGRIWTRVIYRSALYDMKTKKFKCTGIEYNDQTGRVKKISFKEI